MSKTVIIGLTGNIATGKSTVVSMLTQRGALAVDADRLVHEILATNPDAQAEIAARFGPKVRLPDGRIDRKALGAIVFRDSQGLKDLEAIIHPRVGEQVNALLARSDAPVVVLEAIKLLEGQLCGRCDQIWVTDCSREQQIERLVNGRGLTRKQALARVNSQAPQAIKVSQADVVIDTSGTLKATERQVDVAWRRIAPAAAERPVIRRAKASDVDALVKFINAAQPEAPPLERLELLASFGEQGYMLAESNQEIQGVVGWNTEDFIARLRQVWLTPEPVQEEIGRELLEAVCQAAAELMCEVALLFVPAGTGAENIQLFTSCKFSPVALEDLILAWRRAAKSSMPAGSAIMVRKLRDRRVMQPV